MPYSGILLIVGVIGGSILFMIACALMIKRREQAQQLEAIEDTSKQPIKLTALPERNPLISSGKLDARYEKFKNKEEAKAGLALLKKMLPQCNSAYQPSEKNI